MGPARRRPGAAHHRPAGAEEVVVVRGVDDRDPPPSADFQDTSTDPRQVVRVHDGRRMTSNDIVERPGWARHEVPEMVALAAHRTLPPVRAVKYGGLASGLGAVP